VIFARRENARREEDGPAGSRGRGASPARCCGNCSPAGAGLLTWWRRRAPRAPARQGAAGRRPGGGAVPPAQQLALFLRLVAQYLDALAFSRPKSAQGRRAWRAEGVPLKS
jgi:hypothetical protein